MPDPQSADWVTQVTDTIVRTVAAVRDRTTKPAIFLARALVFGLLAGVLGTMALVLGAVMVVRILENYLPGGVWKAHLITGLVFTLAGLFLMVKRNPRAAS
jgi:hypothetical protein